MTSGISNHASSTNQRAPGRNHCVQLTLVVYVAMIMSSVNICG